MWLKLYDYVVQTYVSLQSTELYELLKWASTTYSPQIGFISNYSDH